MSSLCLLPWEASLALLVPRGCPGGARPVPVPVGRSQQGCPSHPSSACQLPVRPLGCLCGNRADTLHVVAKAVFSPSPTHIPQGFPAGKPYTLFSPGTVPLVQTVPVANTLQQRMMPCVVCSLKAWMFWPLFFPSSPIHLICFGDKHQDLRSLQ